MTQLKKSLLIIDDEPDLLDVMKALLEEHGFSVMTAISVQEACRKIYSKKIDLIISDFKMPQGGGTAILNYLNKTPEQKTPIIFVSGHLQPNDQAILKQGALAVLTKPVPEDRLIAVVDNLLKMNPPEEVFNEKDFTILDPKDFDSVEVKITIQFSAGQNSGRIDANLLQIDRPNIILDVKKTDCKVGDTVDVEVITKNQDALVKDAFKGKVTEIEELDPNSSMLTIQAETQAVKELLKIEKMMAARQEEIMQYLFKVKG